MLGDASSIATSDGSAHLSVSNATLLGTTLSATITNGYNISDTASAILAEYNNDGAGNGSVLGDVASSCDERWSALSLSVSIAAILGTTLGATIATASISRHGECNSG